MNVNKLPICGNCFVINRPIGKLVLLGNRVIRCSSCGGFGRISATRKNVVYWSKNIETLDKLEREDEQWRSKIS